MLITCNEPLHIMDWNGFHVQYTTAYLFTNVLKKIMHSGCYPLLHSFNLLANNKITGSNSINC